MGNKSSLLLREEEISEIQAETGCEYKINFLLLAKIVEIFMNNLDFSVFCVFFDISNKFRAFSKLKV
jgi:hypothetical protein